MLIAGPNFAIDRTLFAEEFRPGETVHLSDAVVTAGGKGVNVARAAKTLGLTPTLVALVPGHMGGAAAELLRDENIVLTGVAMSGELRFALIVLEANGRATVLNEPAPELAAHEWAVYAATVVASLDDHGVVVCSGSLPPGAPAKGYAQLVTAAHEHGCTVVVDASGQALAEALAARPDVVCPNLSDAEGVVSALRSESVEVSVDAAERAVAAARALVRLGARHAVVTAAGAGAAIAQESEATTCLVRAPTVTVRNQMGAGDAFVAGLAAELELGADVRQACRTAVAIAAASVEHPRAGYFDPARAEALKALVTVDVD